MFYISEEAVVVGQPIEVFPSQALAIVSVSM
jgi:hypothetical protein